jgi:transcription initiation factor TFIID subunit 12
MTLESVSITSSLMICMPSLSQLRGAVTAAQQAQQLQQQQQGVRPNPPAPQQARPVPTQQQQQVRPNPQQQQQQMQQQQQGQGRPPNNPPDLQALMLQMQKMADPIGRKIKELEATLARPAHQGGLAPNTAERTKVEMEHNEVKQQQAKLMQQFMSVKAQYLAQTGQAQQSQQMQQQLLLQQQRAQQAAASAQAANNGNNNAASLSQAQALANQNRGVGTPPLNIRPSPGPKVRPAPEQQGSRPQTPGVSQGSTGARSSPSGQGQPGRSSTPANNASPHFQQPHIPPEAMTQRSNLISGPSNASGMAGGSNQGPFGAGIPTNLNVQPSVPEPYPNSTGPRPTLNQGLGTNPTLGTPAILQRPDLVSTNAAGGIASGSGAGLSSWEELLGTVAREGKSGANGLTGSEMDAITMDLGNPDFWDALTGKGTGADSLINAGTTSATSGGGAGMTSGDGRLLTKRKVQELVAEIDGNERLEGDVEDVSKSRLLY